MYINVHIGASPVNIFNQLHDNVSRNPKCACRGFEPTISPFLALSLPESMLSSRVLDGLMSEKEVSKKDRGQCRDFENIFAEKWKRIADLDSKCCYFMQKI
jgi:hypothetical protein